MQGKHPAVLTAEAVPTGKGSRRSLQPHMQGVVWAISGKVPGHLLPHWYQHCAFAWHPNIPHSACAMSLCQPGSRTTTPWCLQHSLVQGVVLSIQSRSSPGGAATSTMEHCTAVGMELRTIPIACFPSKRGTSSRGAARAVAVASTLPSARSLTCSVEATL